MAQDLFDILEKANLTQVDTHERGNTSNLSCEGKKNRKWFMTINNYSKEELKLMTQFCTSKKEYIVCEEIGEEKGIPHIHAFINCKNAVRWKTLKKMFPRARIEIGKGTGADNLVYCSKGGKYITNLEPLQLRLKNRILKQYETVKWHKWQQQVLKTISASPDARAINWLYEGIGNIGKSFLAKYIVLRYNAIIADGKKDNVFNQIKTAMDAGIEPKIIILDIPRHNIDYVNYGAIEQIKNGMIYSGKYEGGICIFEIPHVVIFANTPPNINKLSLDRWNIINITSSGGENAPPSQAVCLPPEQPPVMKEQSMKEYQLEQLTML